MHSQFVPRGEQIDLTNCDREPIHTPGTVQAHGGLLAVDIATERILAASENIGAFIGASREQTVNALIDDVLGTAAADVLRSVTVSRDPNRAAVTLPLPRRDIVASVQRAGNTAYVEFEARVETGISLVGATRDAVRSFIDSDDVEALCALGAEQLRELTGYDRVMIYRFDPDGHGQVIAEARDERLEAFLGRHYPASDIPRQARALYRTTMLRMIVDVLEPAVPIVPALDLRSGQPWDLSSAILRSSSPIHLEYLRNMGVTATLTVSLMRNGELWGLIACHHYTPKFAGADVRYATETVGHTLVSRIVQLEDARIFALQMRARDAVDAFIVRAATGGVEVLATDRVLHDALGVHGTAFVNGSIVTAGDVPAADALRALVAWLAERSGSERFTTDTLGKLNPAFSPVAHLASGVYGARIGDTWFLRSAASNARPSTGAAIRRSRPWPRANAFPRAVRSHFGARRSADARCRGKAGRSRDSIAP